MVIAFLEISFCLALLVFGVLAVAKPHDTRWLQCFFVISTAFVVMGSLATIFDMLGSRLYAPANYDQWFFIADTWLGSPSWYLGREIALHPFLGTLARVDYSGGFYMLVAAVIVTMISQSVARGWRCYGTLSTQGLLAVPFYTVFPACGPVHAFSGFPWHLPKLAAPHVLRLNALPNCMPSVHFSSALMVAFFLSRWRIGRWVGSLHVALTVLATLGLGEHYLIDLLAAIPYAYVLLRVWGWIPRRDSGVHEERRKALEREQVNA